MIDTTVTFELTYKELEIVQKVLLKYIRDVKDKKLSAYAYEEVLSKFAPNYVALCRAVKDDAS